VRKYLHSVALHVLNITAATQTQSVIVTQIVTVSCGVRGEQPVDEVDFSPSTAGAGRQNPAVHSNAHA
jgi:hypothetical protein